MRARQIIVLFYTLIMFDKIRLVKLLQVILLRYLFQGDFSRKKRRGQVPTSPRFGCLS